MSRWLSPFERRMLWRRRRWIINILLFIFILLTIYDRAIYNALYVGPYNFGQLRGTPRYELVRAAGYLPTWMVIGAALVIQNLRRPLQTGSASMMDRCFAYFAANSQNRAAWAGPLTVLSGGISGLIAELTKPIFGRLRPYQTDGLHRYHGFPDNLAHAASYGLPSGHAAVAFGAAFMLVHLYPRIGVIAVAVAAGCSLSRLMAGSHFATDIFIAAVLAYAIAGLVRAYPGRYLHIWRWPAHRDILLP